MTPAGTLAIIPARGGSKGFPGKNLAPLAGLPLVGHAIECARLIPSVTRCIVSTDDCEIAQAARELGAEVPFLRPAQLATDSSPMSGVVSHALRTIEQEGDDFQAVLLLDPTSPCRDPKAIERAIDRLFEHPDAAGVVSVSEPYFQPTWVGVRSVDGVLSRFFTQEEVPVRRQDLPERYLRINGSFYIWRANYARSLPTAWLDEARHLGFETPESRSFSIDTREEFELIDALLRSRFIELPWLERTNDN